MLLVYSEINIIFKDITKTAKLDLMEIVNDKFYRFHSVFRKFFSNIGKSFQNKEKY